MSVPVLESVIDASVAIKLFVVEALSEWTAIPVCNVCW
jgi:hypothetical protein